VGPLTLSLCASESLKRLHKEEQPELPLLWRKRAALDQARDQ